MVKSLIALRLNHNYMLLTFPVTFVGCLMMYFLRNSQTGSGIRIRDNMVIRSPKPLKFKKQCLWNPSLFTKQFDVHCHTLGQFMSFGNWMATNIVLARPAQDSMNIIIIFHCEVVNLEEIVTVIRDSSVVIIVC